MNTYYVYTHTRLDTNQIFYVGIGTKNTNKKYLCKIYQRAYYKSLSKRTKFWINVYKSCSNSIDINIIFESTSLKEVQNKEIELIKMYGRRDLGLGNLVNLTDGGEGTNNNKWSLEQKEKRSLLYKENNPFKDKHHTIKTKEMLSNIHKQKYTEGYIHPSKGIPRTDEIKNILSLNGKKRWKEGTLHKPPIMKGNTNYFSKNFIAISPDNKEHFISGGIKSFCLENKLSYSYIKKFLDKGKCICIDRGRARKLALNTEGWEFKTFKQ
jgi:hypothetical protein